MTAGFIAERINAMSNKLIGIAIVVVIIIGVIYAITPGSKIDSGNVASVTTSDFDQKVLQSKDTVLVDFWASWCGPCKMMSPIVDEISVEYAGKLKVYKVNVDENQPLASQYQVNSIPTLMIFKNGQMVDQQVGLSSKRNITQWIDSFAGKN
jgi:thioredoxin 1